MSSEPMPKEEGPSSFMVLCATLGTQVHMALGLIPDPVTEKATVELPAAQQGIEMLAMLETKTKGNLEDREEKLLNDLLMQLRMIYVQVAKAATQQGEQEKD